MMTKKRWMALVLAICIFGGISGAVMGTETVSAAGYIHLEKDDFSNIADGTLLTPGGVSNPGNWKLYYYSNANSVNDPVMYQDGGIQFTKSAKGGNIVMYKDMSQTAVTTGKVTYSFDAAFQNPSASNQVYWEDYFLRLGANVPADRSNNQGLCYSGVGARTGMLIMPKGGASNASFMKNLLGTEMKNHHFEYALDYTAGTYTIKVDDTFITSSGKTEFPIPEDFIANGGAKYFMINMKLQSVASIEDFVLKLTNFTVTTGESMWPEEGALTASDVTANSAKLSWNPVSSEGVSGYEIYNGTTKLATVADTTYTVTGLVSDSSYTFSVKPLFSDSRAFDSAPSVTITTKEGAKAGFLALEKDDFSNIANSTQLTPGGVSNPGNWKLYYYSTSAANDPIVYQDGGIRFTKSAKGGNILMYKDMSGTVVTSGKVTYSFDAKFKNPVGSNQVYWEDYFLRLGANVPTPGDRTNNQGLCYSGMMAKAGMVIMPKGGAANQTAMQSILGTENKNHHFEYILDYDAGTYSVKVDGTAITSSGKTEFPIPDDFLANGGAKYFMINMRLQSTAAIDDFVMELKNFHVITGESMWPAKGAVTVSDITANSAKLSWHPLATKGVVGYEIYNGTTKLAEVTNTTYTATGLVSDSTYTFSVKPLFSDSRAFDNAPTITVSTGGFAAREGNLTDIAAGRSHMIGINKNEKVYAHGDNSFGQLTAFPEKAQAVAAGYDSSYVIDKKGNLYAWGANYSGQLGIGSDAMIEMTPTKVSGIEHAQAVAAGAEHVLVLANGKVYAFGDNRYGQLGTQNSATVTANNTPVLVSALSDKTVTAVAAGKYTSFAVCANGDLYAWGMNYMAQLGDGNDALDNRDTPVRISIPDHKVLSVAAGGGHTVAICYKDENQNGVCDEATSVWGWGSNSRAQLGTGALGTWNHTPTKLSFFDGKNIISLAAGDGHTMALAENGTLYTCGWNENGQLGQGDLSYGLTPEAVSGIPSVRMIAAGDTYSLAVGTDGSLWSWGANDDHQIDGSNTAQYVSPAKIKLALGEILFGDSNIRLTDGKQNISVSVYNNSGKTFGGKVYICVYRETDGKRELTAAYPSDVVLEKEQTTTVNQEIILLQSVENTFVQVFAWDANMAPYAEVYEIR